VLRRSSMILCPVYNVCALQVVQLGGMASVHSMALVPDFLPHCLSLCMLHMHPLQLALYNKALH
jgi:hypothetical protein